LKHKNLTISIDDPNDKHYIHVDPSTDSDGEGDMASMGSMGGMGLKKALNQNGLQIENGEVPKACCFLF
jgi:hypothetical protein